MIKKLVIALVLLISFMSVSPIFAKEDASFEENDSYQQQVNCILNGFYDNRTEYFEIIYGEGEKNQRDYFYNQTVLMYKIGDYKGIINYLSTHNVMIIEDHMNGVEQRSNGTHSVNKTVSRIFNPNAGFNFTVIAKFTGSFTVTNAVITNVNISHNLSYTNSSAGYYTVTFPNKTFEANGIGLKVYIELETDVQAKQNVQPYSLITYPNVVFTATVS